jgi:hypothetical protein
LLRSIGEGRKASHCLERSSGLRFWWLGRVEAGPPDLTARHSNGISRPIIKDGREVGRNSLRAASHRASKASARGGRCVTEHRGAQPATRSFRSDVRRQRSGTAPTRSWSFTSEATETSDLKAERGSAASGSHASRVHSTAIGRRTTVRELAPERDPGDRAHPESSVGCRGRRLRSSTVWKSVGSLCEQSGKPVRVSLHASQGHGRVDCDEAIHRTRAAIRTPRRPELALKGHGGSAEPIRR